MKNKVTINNILQKKNKKEKIVAVTAYDATMATLVDKSGVDLILVGDSLGMVFQGHENTLQVTMDEMIYHCKAVKRGASRPFLVLDLPFGTFQESLNSALKHSINGIKNGGAQAVKIEGMTENVINIIRHLSEHGIPVMGHLGLTPQSIHKFGGFKKQGKDEESSRKILEGALKLEKAGVFSIVLESIPSSLGKIISEKLTIPTIGIGAGPDCDGQVLVINDLLGMDDSFCPDFAKKYTNLSKTIIDSVNSYCNEVRDGIFPEKK
jgi:3-methyl-2-oxobutanoate hydroxymethyltransferase